MRNSYRLIATRAHNQYIGSRNRAFPFRDSALDLLLRIRPRVPLDHHDVLDQHLAGLPVHAQHAPRLALIAPRDHLDGVFPLQIDTLHQITSGASETIFMNFLSRSSRATGPNTRVPTGSPTSLISTAAFESKRM